jgi:hypothetical protein
MLEAVELPRLLLSQTKRIGRHDGFRGRAEKFHGFDQEICRK